MGAGGGKGSSLVIYNLKLSLLHLNTPLCSCKQRNVYTRGGRRFGNMLSWWKLDKTAALKDMQCWQPVPCALILTLVIICRLAGCIYHQLSGFSCWHSMEKVMERIVRTEKDGAFKDPVWSSTTWGTIPVEREKIMQSPQGWTAWRQEVMWCWKLQPIRGCSGLNTEVTTKVYPDSFAGNPGA